MRTKQPILVAVEIITFLTATFCLYLRILSRSLRKNPLWWDDFFAIACYLIAIAWLAVLPLWMNEGGLGLHIENMAGTSAEVTISRMRLFLYIAEIIYAFGMFFAKMSILFFYWRLFNITRLRYPIIALMGAAIIWIIIRTFMAIFHCVPVQAFWNFTPGAVCNIDDKKFFFGSVLAHVCLDFLILSLPLLEIRRLQLRLIQKVGIMAMFLFGILICVCALGIIVETSKFNEASPDLTWNISNIAIWATAEVNLITISACFPTIRPAFVHLFGRFIPKSSWGSSAQSYGQSHRYRSPNLRSIKLNTIPTDDDDGLADDAGLTYNQLARSMATKTPATAAARGALGDYNRVRGGGGPPAVERGRLGKSFETYALDRQRSVRRVDTALAPDSDGSDLEKEWRGIYVTTETIVRISPAPGVHTNNDDDDNDDDDGDGAAGFAPSSFPRTASKYGEKERRRTISN
ncbi:hypothetical protein BX600DRAFT_154444 [Xylariales sp. PMI_506]|nr:hypothetical protein BX600DRAFT_154444 [Xylariales sp. PMI_506]